MSLVNSKNVLVRFSCVMLPCNDRMFTNLSKFKRPAITVTAFLTATNRMIFLFRFDLSRDTKYANLYSADGISKYFCVRVVTFFDDSNPMYNGFGRSENVA